VLFRSLVLAAAWVLTVCTIWYGNQAWQAVGLKSDAAKQLTATERELEVALSARGQALAGQERAFQLAKLFDQPDLLQLFAVTNDVLIQARLAGSLQLAEWELRGSQLKFVLAVANGSPPPATTIVKAFETVQTLRDVEAAVDGSRISVSARVVPFDPQALVTPRISAPPVAQ